MNIGELWVAHPFFPWLMIILALWVAFSTAAIIRNWVYILRLKRHNKLLQDMVVEGIGNVARQIKEIHLEGKCTEEPATAVIEEAAWEPDPPRSIVAQTNQASAESRST